MIYFSIRGLIMKKYLLIPVIFLVSLCLASTAFAFGFQLEYFDTQVKPNKDYADSSVNFSVDSWYDKIEDPNTSIFDTFGMSLTGDDSVFTFTINTNFSGYSIIGGVNHYIGDLFIFTDNNTFGFNLGKWDDSSTATAPVEDNPYKAGFYLIGDIMNAYTSHDYLSSYQNLIYGAGYKATSPSEPELAPSVKIHGKYEQIKSDQVSSLQQFSADFYQTNNPEGDYTYTYTLTGTFDLMAAMELNWGNSFNVLFATATCANSGGYAQVATQTPEPGTIALLGLGLIGLFFGRKRFSRK